jgi:hypothetical protein
MSTRLARLKEAQVAVRINPPCYVFEENMWGIAFITFASTRLARPKET